MTKHPNNGTFGLPLEHQSSTGETSELSTNTSRVESSYDSRFPRVAGPRPVGDPDIPLYEEIERLQSENFAWRTKLGIRGYEIQIADLTQQLAAANAALAETTRLANVEMDQHKAELAAAIADAETNANETARVFELLAAERKARILAESDCAAAIMREEAERKAREEADIEVRTYCDSMNELIEKLSKVEYRAEAAEARLATIERETIERWEQRLIKMTDYSDGSATWNRAIERARLELRALLPGEGK